MSYDADDIRRKVDLLRDLHELGGVDLDPTRRTIGFERRALSPDTRPKAAPSWGIAPLERE